MTRRRTAHSRARSRSESSGASNFNIYRISRNQERSGPYEAKRIYPEVHNVNTYAHASKLVQLIEHDSIPDNLKRQRLQFMYALTYAPSFKAQYRGNIENARDLFYDAYRKYTEPEKAI